MYFDADRCDDQSTALTEEGANLVLDWYDILLENGYDLRSPMQISESSSYLIANDHSDVDFMSTKIMLAILACGLDMLDASE